MNANEMIVEGYFRLVRGCLTTADVKVKNSFGRQLDLLAYDGRTGDQYHIEVSVKHDSSFCMNVPETATKLRQKFFGAEKDGRNSPYLGAIREAYRSVGFDYQKVVRVWCPWAVVECEDPEREIEEAFRRVAKEHSVRRPRFELLLFRDQLIPDLLREVGSCNYENSALRLMSLIAMAEKQKMKSRSGSLSQSPKRLT